MDKVECSKCGAIISQSRWNQHAGSNKCKMAVKRRSKERASPTVVLTRTAFPPVLEEKYDTFQAPILDEDYAYSALDMAIEHSNLQVARRLLEAGVSADRAILHEGLLSVVIDKSDTAMAQLLLEYTRDLGPVLQQGVYISMLKKNPLMTCFFHNRL